MGWLGQPTGVNALVQVGILVSDAPEECSCHGGLELEEPKDVQEATSGDPICNLGIVALHTAGCTTNTVTNGPANL